MYKEQLRNHICVVVFRKQNGQLRTMRCTLKSNYIDDNNLHPTGGGHSYPDNQIRCVDIDINEWRSFKTDTIVSFDIEE